LKVPYFIPWITNEDKKAVQSVLSNRWLTNGPTLEKFENKIGKFLGSKYSLGVGSATHALHLALRSIGVGKGDEVIVPTFTFAATANAVLYCGAKPILTDVEYDTFNISPKQIQKKITKKTKAIIPVHYGGQSCDMDEIKSISKKHDLFVIEDCAHALGSKFNNELCGNIGDLGCFSFYATKVITTGEGGMVTTSTKKLYEKVKLLRSQAMTVQAKERETKAKWKYDVVDLGYNYRLDEMRAALGLSQIKRIKQINQMRQKIAKKYDFHLTKIKGITIPQKKSNRNHIYHLYSILIEKDFPLTRDELFSYLHKAGIGTSVQYCPLHFMSLYKKDYKNNLEFTNANLLKEQILCLPIFPKMTIKNIEFIVSKLKKLI